MAFSRRSVIGGLGASLLPCSAFAKLARQGDAALVGELLRVLHPGLLRYQSRAEFERRHARFAAAWQARPDLPSRYLALSRLLSAIRCGHSYVNPYNQTPAIIAELTTGRALLPFLFRWLGDRMVVTGDPHGAGLVPGTVVRRIDGVSSSKILAALLPLARADGANEGKRRANLDLRGSDEFEAFDLFHPLLFPIGPRVRLEVEQGGRVLTRNLDTVSRAQRLAARPPEPAPDSAEPAWSVRRIDRTALLNMPGWALYNSRWDWKSWLDERFAEWVRDGVSGLVVDLRDNEGGLDCGDRLLAHLVDRPLAAPAQRNFVRFRTVPEKLRPHLDTWDQSFFTLGQAATLSSNGLLELGGGGNDGWPAIAPLAPRFRGKVAVIVEPMNSSATFGFAQRVKGSGLATLVGQETGGNRQGINGGAFFFARLPESGLEFDLPLIWQTPATPQPDEAIRPDVAVPVRAEDLLKGRDAVLERALQLVA